MKKYNTRGEFETTLTITIDVGYSRNSSGTYIEYLKFCNNDKIYYTQSNSAVDSIITEHLDTLRELAFEDSEDI